MKKKILIAVALVLAAACVYSFVPVAVVYLKPNPPITLNSQSIDKLKNNEGDMFGFIVFGDNHAGLIFDDSSTLKLIKRMNYETRFKKMPIDFVMSPGDTTFRGSAWDYKMWNKVRAESRYPVIAAMGNHDNDRDKTKSSLFKKYNGEREFAFVDRNSYFIVIDNTPGELTEKQFEHLEDNLKTSLEYKHRFIIMHKSPISPYQQSWYRPEMNPWAYRFMKLCEKYKVDMVFMGHEHMYRKMIFGGVKYVVSGGGGIITHIPTCDGGYLHYVVVRVRGDYVDYEVRRVFPPLWEYFGYYMWKDIFYTLKDILF